MTSKRTANLEEAAFLDLARTTELLSGPIVQLLKTEDLSATPYNVLRILRGSPEGLTCGQIAERMITRDPDITRLLDRLEKRKLIARNRDDKDRRVVLTRITAEGLHLLERLDQPLRQLHRKLLGHIGPERLRTLSQLLEACRSGLR
jgi:DNA-binding MarR family transcriptional regulator